ncbi:MAG TPA: alpha/beta hydrolase [Bacteroidales bacterium]|nr:alpha/beta hydrolase [Bacteroidales bacterium]
MIRDIDLEGKKVRISDNGKGPTLVLLHGFLEDLSMWEYFSATLSTKYRVIAIDLPGFGGTEALGKKHSMKNMAGLVKEVIDYLSIDSCVMIGHSMGGYVTLAFAGAYPEKLAGFGLFHSHALADSPEARENRDRAIAVVNSDHGKYIFNFFPALFAEENIDLFSDEIVALQRSASKTHPRSIVAALAGMRDRESTIDVLINTKVPVLFILGKNDSRIPFQATLAQASLPPVSQILVLDKVGHMGFLEAQEATVKFIDGFAEMAF